MIGANIIQVYRGTSLMRKRTTLGPYVHRS